MSSLEMYVVARNCISKLNLNNFFYSVSSRDMSSFPSNCYILQIGRDDFSVTDSPTRLSLAQNVTFCEWAIP